jgi:hypothetical protein
MGNLTAVQPLSPKELIELDHIENEIVGLQFDLKENKAVACRGIDRMDLRYHRPKAFSGISLSSRSEPVPSWYQPARAERPKIPLSGYRPEGLSTQFVFT